MNLKIFHMASMARSGETLLQRHIQAHPQVLVTHNLKEEDAGDELRLFRHLKRSPRLSISASSRLLRSFDTGKKTVLFLKQGVWEHRFPFRGFVLARNPLAIFASLWTYDLKEKGGSPEANWKYNVERLVRWLGDIDPLLIPGFLALEPEQQFALFYNRRMSALLGTGLPIVFYENVVREPEIEFKRICKILGVDFEESVLLAHSNYSESAIGHGHIELARPIDTKSLDKFLEVLTPEQIDCVAKLTEEVASQYGYALRSSPVSIVERERPVSMISRNAVVKPVEYYALKVKRRISRAMLNKSPTREKRTLAAKSGEEAGKYSNLPFAEETMRKLVEEFEFDTVLDVGSGGGAHAKCLIDSGKNVTAIDFGASIYFEKRAENYDYISGDFMEYPFEDKFDCIWASHVLEHQPNPGAFIRRCIELVKPRGILAITVPPLKESIVGGHLSLWNGGMLLYHLCFAGLDCRDISIRRYGYNVAAILRVKKRPEVELHYDSGDIDRLKPYLPPFCHEGFDGRIARWNW